jgi:hypothetical protein
MMAANLPAEENDVAQENREIEIRAEPEEVGNDYANEDEEDNNNIELHSTLIKDEEENEGEEEEQGPHEGIEFNSRGYGWHFEQHTFFYFGLRKYTWKYYPDFEGDERPAWPRIPQGFIGNKAQQMQLLHMNYDEARKNWKE